MNRFFIALSVLLCCTAVAFGQFKNEGDQQSVAQSLVQPVVGGNSLFGLINPNNFTMRQSLSYSFVSGGGMSTSLASFTNSMFYKISDPLNVRFDVTLQGSPMGAATPYQQALNGVFLSRAELNYRPWDNFFVQVEYSHLPSNYWGMYDNPWYHPYTSGMWGGR